jgi:hypothetical protein
MNNNNSLFDTSNSQFVLSYELLSLLQWMTEHDAERLKKIIARGLKSGLRQELQRTKELTESQRVEGAQHNVVEFFGLLEALMHETLHEHTEQTAREKNLMPVIDHIDSTVCDDATIRSSVEKATAKLHAHPHNDPHDTLFKELLKRWKPAKKNILN